MTKIDLLGQLSAGVITSDEAYDLHDEAVASANRGGTPWDEALGFSISEAKAYLHGGTLEQLARIRATGWPTTCCRCGLTLNLLEDYWFFVGREDDVPVIRHVTCPNGVTQGGNCTEEDRA